MVDKEVIIEVGEIEISTADFNRWKAQLDSHLRLFKWFANNMFPKRTLQFTLIGNLYVPKGSAAVERGSLLVEGNENIVVGVQYM